MDAGVYIGRWGSEFWFRAPGLVFGGLLGAPPLAGGEVGELRVWGLV